ncbi:MAG TPA: arginine--tRNA ligase [Chitinophagaceae bacterium]|nr:arginine--tRNA ligase [Chitinophagaceae bacterium]
MFLTDIVRKAIQEAISHQYQQEVPEQSVLLNETKPEFEGDFTLVTFGLAKLLGGKPDEIAQRIGEQLLADGKSITHFNVIKGFLNLKLDTAYFHQFLDRYSCDTNYPSFPDQHRKIMVEYSSPNTNKPLHFGHLRNNFLGSSVASILKATGHDVIKANLINDRGIHICKSMIAWMHFGNGATPQSTGIKGDHLVGDYYVKFNEVFKSQVAEMVQSGMDVAEAEKKAPILLEAQELLRLWEAGDAETMKLWKTMNQWVYEGFQVTYERLGLSFDKWYYESNTYLLGKQIIEKGLASGVLFRKEDGSVWIDLTDEGLDQKLLLRSDGTAVYITQDIGTASLKYSEFGMDASVYVIGDEQNYHMQILKRIMQKLHEPGADGIYHLSYGMVELPSGRMKSREGTVVDADDMIEEMATMARINTETLGKVEGFSDEELKVLYDTLGLGALKFYLLRVDPRKKMIFNPQESIDFHGFTGPFIQYTHARICSILRKAGTWEPHTTKTELTDEERTLVTTLSQYPAVLTQAATEYNPSLLCNYIFQLARQFNTFLSDHPVLKAESETIKSHRLQISSLCKQVLASGLTLLGIHAPERM